MRRADTLLEQMIASAAQLFDLEVAELKRRTSRREVAAARAAVYYVATRVCPTLTMLDIAEHLGQKDRKSAYNGIERCEQYMQQSIGYRRQVQTLLAEFQPSNPEPKRSAEQRRQSMHLWVHLHRSSSAFVKTA